MTLCPLLAQSGHLFDASQCPLLGVKRTCLFALQMSACDPKRTFAPFRRSCSIRYNRPVLGATMRRRDFITFATAAGIIWPTSVLAQKSAKRPVIGVLSPFTDAQSTLLADLRAGLRDFGYIEGQNLKIEYRSAEGRIEQLRGLASDLIRADVDLIVTSSAPAIQIVRETTTKLPVVFASVGDALDQGIVQSLSHPGQNMTGISWFAPELSGKSIDILKEISPKISHAAILREAAAGAASAITAEAAARRHGMKATIFQARTAAELETAFDGMKDAQVDSVIVLEGLMILNNVKSIVALATKSQLPAIFFDSKFVDAGGLVSYGPNFSDMHRRTAYFVDRILKGTKPGDIPVEQPTKFDLVLNVSTAKELGLGVSSTILLRADRIVE
jgi:putative tryptophan/tyrosine transport system substrate-binding protein